MLEVGSWVHRRYRVLSPLGEGGMARVYLVEDVVRGGQCVLKQVEGEKPELFEALRHEFSLLANLAHPRLLKVRSFGLDRSSGRPAPYYTAELVEGVPLSEWARSRSAPEGPWLDALEGLAVLHGLGIRHGDVSPRNILVDRAGHGTLIDLGCARPFGAALATVSGTPGFIAPELLEGKPADGRADLFSAGCALEAIFSDSERTAPPRLAKLIARLKSVDPVARPTDVAEVLEALGREPARQARYTALARQLVGRSAELAQFAEWRHAILAGTSKAPCFVLTGPSGVGLSRLLEECSWRAELECEVATGHVRQARAASALLERAFGIELHKHSLVELVDLVRSRTHDVEPLLLVLDDVDQLPPSELARLTGLARLLEPGSRVGMLLSTRKPEPFEDCSSVLRAGPLGLDDLRTWTRGALPERRLSLLLRYTAGLPSAIGKALTAMRSGTLSDAELARAVPLEHQAERSIDLDLGVPETKSALALLVALDGDLDTEDWPIPTSVLDALSRAELTELFGARVTVRRRADLALLREVLGASAVRAAHRKVAQRLSTFSPLATELTRHLVLSGALEQAENGFLVRARSSPPTRELLDSAEPLAQETKRVDVLSALASLALGAGEPGRALSLCARALALCSSSVERAGVRLLGADIYLKLGRASRAAQLLTRAEPQARGTSDEARLCELRARVHIQIGNFVEAEASAQEGISLSPEEPLLAAALEEALGAACSHRDERERAEAHFTRALSLLGAEASPRVLCRIASHRAIVHFRAGAIAAAAERYREALRIAEDHELDDLMAVGSLNLGTAEHQGGELGSALRSYERGLDLARALGRKSTELTLRYNLANLYAELGAFERSESMLSELLARCGPHLLGHFSAPVALLRAELLLQKGELDGCGAELEGARAVFGSRERKRELVETMIVLSELRLAEGRSTEAHESAQDAAATARDLGADDLVARALLAIARASLASNGDDPIGKLEEAQRLARASGLRLLDVQIEAELFRSHQRAHQPRQAAAHAERARRLWDRMASGLPSQMRELFWRHPRRARSNVTQTFEATFRDASTEVQTLRRLLSVNKRLNSALTVERVLDAALDAALELTLAERAFLMLREQGEVEGAEPKIVVARHSGGSLSKSERPSQSIVMQALANEVPVLTTDALRDPRFSAQRSVHAMRLKSVLCVPISTPQGVLGALYVDNRVERGLFSEASREVLMTLADQVAIALENARLHDQLEARTRELADQKRAVERLSRGQARAIVKLERELASQKEVLDTRFDYAQIAGRGAAMRAVLSKLDRVTDADINVLVRGASGTGKELIARALHYNGARKQGPFIAVNCAALPENLLESELFGHVKGAFTGADRDKQGLMLAASGGTLFLDELGEMPLSTQAKLLRVLQEREVRPVGATRVAKLDVRLVCATNRDLQSDVATGAFREDLYYRVAVVQVALPTLQERSEDIPDIARAILARLSREKNSPAPELTREALRALMAHPWPGNVRELENALTRAYVLSDRSRITPTELDLGAAKPALRSTNRAQFRVEERERIFDALRSSGWNVSHVSRSLGIPRNTLYRKMREHGIEKSR